MDKHLGLVRSIAVQVRRQLSPSVELDDLVAYGSEGLLEAAERFDERVGCAFSTFAYHRIRGAIYDGLRRMGQLGRADFARLRAAQRATAVLASLAERERGAAASAPAAPSPTVEADLRALHGALQAVAVTYVMSLEAAGEAGLEIAADGPSAEDTTRLRQLGARVRAAITTLPDKERHFIEKHYFEDKSLTAAGAELGLSKSWASRLHARAVEMLRDSLGEDDG